MKAIRVNMHGGPEVLKLEDISTPSPQTGQVLVRVKAIGVNPVETYIRNGGYMPVEIPYTPGTDCAGIVEAVGEDVTQFTPGDRVYTAGTLTGAYAEFSLVNADRLYPLPPEITFAQGAALGIPYATAYQALFNKAHAAPGEWLLVHGASGGVGTAAVQWARAAGLTIIGTGGTPEGRKLVDENGAHHVLDHRSAKYTKDIMAITGGRGVDVILEMLSNVNLGKDLPLLAPGGRVVVIGSRGPVEINPRDTMARDATILGMTLFNATSTQIKGIHAAIYAGLESKTLRPVIGKELSLSEAVRAHTLILEPGSYGKIILNP